MTHIARRLRRLPGILLLSVAAALAWPAPGRACGWDQDTVWVDARYMRDVLAVMVGRFPRNPPLYYEMRLQRTTGQLQQHPEDLAAYDDAAVACDRLGRPDEALTWMERKKAQLDHLAESEPARKDHLYRYLANSGTFYYHRWLKQGASRADLTDVQRARRALCDAIGVNPKAHFGREKYQVLAMEWILSPGKRLGTINVFSEAAYERRQEGQKVITEPKLIPGFLPGLTAAVHPSESKYPDAVRGLAGLIALGSSWESVEVFHNLALALRLLEGRTALSAIASLRAWELIDEGQGTLYPDPPQDLKAVVGFPLDSYAFEGRDWEETQQIFGKLTRQQYRELKGATLIKKQFYALRKEAEVWSHARSAYLLQLMQKGMHPDTHPDFWRDFQEPALPMLARAKQDPNQNLLGEFDGGEPAAAASAADKR